MLSLFLRWGRPVAEHMDRKLRIQRRSPRDPSSGSIPSRRDVFITDDKIFIYHSLRAVRNYTDMVYFNGQRSKALFDSANPWPHLLLHNKMLVRSWKTIAQHINTTYTQQSKFPAASGFRAVHVHNEFNLGDVLLTVLDEYRKSNLLRFPKGGVFNITRSQLHATLDCYQPPVVLTNTVDENWGFLSTFIANRTTKWINLTNHLLLHHSNYDTLRYFLDSPKV